MDISSLSIGLHSGKKDRLMFDMVTQTLEREAFDYLLDLEVKKAARYLYYFSLMVLQKDKILRGLSPPEEEALTRKLAAIVKEEVRATDMIGRFENDKFFLILDQADFQSSFKVGVRIKDRIENYAFKTNGNTVGMTTSIGIACFPTHANDIVTLRRKVDIALNMAKEGGGGKVCLPDSD
ncbi:MAG: GGDEF domain-containing protein [Nitrospirae bacterium]|nr:GGDEF domain-containing protein [Nitrospirota bacterium]